MAGFFTLIYILSGNLLAAGVIGIEVAQLHVEHGGLQLVKATVASTITEDVFLL